MAKLVLVVRSLIEPRHRGLESSSVSRDCSMKSGDGCYLTRFRAALFVPQRKFRNHDKGRIRNFSSK